MREWAKTSVGILGAGIENISLARFLLRQGALVVIYDKNSEEEIQQKLNGLANDNLSVVTGENYLQKLEKHDIFFRSPGMPLQEARRVIPGGALLSSAMQLFFELCPARTIGVTGTKGKGTTSSLISEMLSYQSEVKAYLVGNIGKAPFDILESLKHEDWVVVELSSFQLEDMTKGPHIAVVLGITSDHLAPLSDGNPNYHASLESYIAAKRRIVENLSERDFAVLVDEGPGAEFARHTQARVYRCRQIPEHDGCFVRDGWVIIKDDDKEVRIIETASIPLPGDHNVMNVQAAVMASYLAGVEPEEMAAVVRNFRGLPHRLQFIREVGGVRYYDDSYATGPDPTIAAVRAFKGPIVLILGGSYKGADFSKLAQVVKESSVNSLILIGNEAERIEQALKAEGVELDMVRGLKEMGEIVKKANDLAQGRGVVLLSPACASFGMFKNATDRANQFQQAVMQL